MQWEGFSSPGLPPVLTLRLASMLWRNARHGSNANCLLHNLLISRANTESSLDRSKQQHPGEAGQSLPRERGQSKSSNWARQSALHSRRASLSTEIIISLFLGGLDLYRNKAIHPHHRSGAFFPLYLKTSIPARMTILVGKCMQPG